MPDPEVRGSESEDPLAAASDILAEEQDLAEEEPYNMAAFSNPGFELPAFGAPAPLPVLEEGEEEEPYNMAAFSFGGEGQRRRVPGAGAFRLPMPGYSDTGYAPAPMEHPAIKGLEFMGGEIKNLPPELTEEVPIAFKQIKGRLNEEELQGLWYQTAAIYNNTRDTKERTRVLGDFIHEWNPDAAERLGYRPGGEIEPEGVWAVLDGIDKYIDRPLRTLVNTIWDIRKGSAAADLSEEIESPGLDEAWRMLKRNWADDKGTIEDMEGAMKSLLLFSKNALTGFDDKDALLSGEGYEEAEDAFAETLTEFGWDVAAPVIKLLTGASDEDIQTSIEEAVAGGSQGGHFTIGLASGALISPLNFIGGAGLIEKGLGEAAVSLLRGGIKLTPRGAEIAATQARLANSTGRRMLVSELAEEFGEESIGSLAEISRRIDRAEEALSAREGRFASLASGEAGEIAFGGERALTPEAIAAAKGPSDDLLNQIDRIKGIKDDLVVQFDDELARIKGDAVPASALREDAAFRAAAVVAANTTEAVNQAFKYKVPLRGAFAVEQLTRLQAFAKAKKIDIAEMNSEWAKGLRQADAADEVLVKVIPTHYGDQIIKSEAITKSPEVAFLYEKALAGEYGQSARLAALRPEYSSLEKLLSRGLKGVPKLEELKAVAAADLAALQKKGMRFAPIRGQIKKGAEQLVERVRGGKAGLRKLKDPKRALLNGENLATNVNPAMFSMAHKLAQEIPWLDRARRIASGVGRLTKHPQAFTRRNAVTGKLEALKRSEIEHPAKFYGAQKLDRQRAITRQILQSRYPMAKASLLRITDDPAMLELMNHAVEMGWADPKTAMSSLDEVVTVAAIRKLNEVNQRILDSLSEVTEGGITVNVLSAEDTERALNALEQLASVERLDDIAFPGYDSGMIDELSQQIAEYGTESERLAGLQARRPSVSKTSDEVKDRTLKLSMLKKRLQVFGAYYEANVRASVKLQTELRIAGHGSG